MKIEFFKKEYLPYLIVIIAVLPSIFLRDFTISNELRYLCIADEALENHHYFSFTVNGQPYADKPPLYLWFLMFGKWLFGSHQMWYISLFSIIPTLAITEIMRRWTSEELKGKWKSIAQIAFLSTVMVLAMFLVLRMDILMCLFIVLALRTFWLMWSQKDFSVKSQILLGLYTFLALFTKGPIGVLVPILVPFVWLLAKREWKMYLRYWSGKTWLVLFVFCVLWFSAVYWEGGREYLDNLLFHQTIDRAHDSFKHARPFYFYGLSVLYMMLPLAFLIIESIIFSVVKKEKRSDLQDYFLTVTVTVFVMLSCFSSKLDVYLLPIYPFCIYLGVILWQNHDGCHLLKVAHYLYLLPIAVVSIVSVVGFAISIVYNIYTDDLHVHHLDDVLGVKLVDAILLYAPILTFILCICFASAMVYGIRKDYEKSIRSVFIGLYATIFVGSFALPYANTFIGYKELCEQVNKICRDENLKVVYSYDVTRAPNMSVFLDYPLKEIESEKDVLSVNPDGVLLYEDRIDAISGLIINKKVERIGNVRFVSLKEKYLE